MKWIFSKPPTNKNYFQSNFNDPISMGTSFGKKALFVGNVPQSGGEFTYMWDNVIKQIKHDDKIKNCLVLGVAGGTAIKILKIAYPKIEITGVELDPVIIDVAKKFLDFNIDSKTKIIFSDALLWIKKNTTKYDLIVVDLYLGDLNPPEARKIEFLKNVNRSLKQGGFILYNCHYQSSKEEEYEEFIRNVIMVFNFVKELFVFPKNKILLIKNV